MACEPGRRVIDFKAAVGKCVTFTFKLKSEGNPLEAGMPIVVRSVTSDGHVHFVTETETLELVDTEHHPYYIRNGWPVAQDLTHKDWIYVDPSKCKRAYDYLYVVRKLEMKRDETIQKAQKEYFGAVQETIKRM